MYGRLARLPVDMEIGLWDDNQMEQTELQQKRELANQNLTKRQEVTSKRSAEKLLGRWKVYSPGTKVKYKDHRSLGATGPGSRKFLAKWRGPYEVIERRGPVYLIRNETHQHRVHGSQLAPWYETNNARLAPTTATAMEPTRRSSRERRPPERLLLHVNSNLPGEECCDQNSNNCWVATYN